MITLCFFPILILGFIAGFAYFYNKTKKVLGSVLILLIGLISAYAVSLVADMIITMLGFATRNVDLFYRPEGAIGIITVQSIIFIGCGLVGLFVHYYLLKDSKATEVSFGFWWMAIVLLLSGGFDMAIEVIRVVNSPILQLCLTVGILMALILVAVKFRDRIFKQKEGGELTGEAPKKAQK